mmetsp:Transcript_7257/g.14866  ORF Transcript_7257/g.14866 Transcript_7257/m.14866 type:complete len:725 (-) Transcript_7257:162-2336(-)
MSKDEGTAQTEQETTTVAGDGKPPAAPGSSRAVAGGSTGNIPKCVCSWKNCRVYQKFFRDHQVWDGVIKLKFTNTEPEGMALKASIDRILKVPDSKSQDWKAGRGDSEAIKYNVACHHWTEQHIRKYRGDPKHYSFVKPFSVHGAQKYLYKVDQRETFKDPSGDAGEDSEPLYLQSPLVPKEEVKNLFYRIKEEAEKANTSKEAPAKRASKNRKGDDHDDDSGSNRNVKSLYDEPRPVKAEDRKGSMRGLTPEERKDSLTVSTHSKTSDLLLQEKEVENKRLKDQLEAMQSQLSFLHDMVQKLQEEHYDQHSARGGGRTTGGRPNRPNARPRNNADGSSRRTGSRSSRSSVPNEIEIESEDDGNWIEPAIDEEWSEEDDDDDEDEMDDGERSTGTFHVQSNDRGGMQRRNSFSSRASRATSIVSASKSVKSLPREIELDDDDDESHESLEEEAFDNKSFASSKKRPSRSQRRSNASGSANRRQSTGFNGKQPRRRQSIGANSRGGGSTFSGHSRGGRSKNSNDADSLSGVYQVTALTVTDPYGEQGTYTGSISNTTGMPHGFGRLEYDKAGRWYEGDWRHGRWTGQGRLSNGDGDFYEGGLKSDHKHGGGVMKFADGRIFEGEYINGQMVEGKMTYQDGSTYTGGWVDGMRHGRGRCVFTDQSVYEGEFREGEFFGFGKMSWSDGGWYEGEWYNGEMQGYGKEIRPDGSMRHEGQWSKGQPIRK